MFRHDQADIVKTSNRAGAVVGYILASGIGLVSPFLLAIVSAHLFSLIDPSARFASFYLMPVRHPLRLAAAGLTLHLLLGAAGGTALFYLARRFNTPNDRLIWLFFLAGFVLAVAITSSHLNFWPSGWLVRVGLFIAASAVTLHLPRWMLRST